MLTERRGDRQTMLMMKPEKHIGKIMRFKEVMTHKYPVYCKTLFVIDFVKDYFSTKLFIAENL